MNDKLFPIVSSAEILGELSAWTSVSDIMVAARIIEDRTVPGDQPESALVLPLEHEEPAFEEIFAILLGYLIEGYVVPPQKIAVCRALDAQITKTTEDALLSLRLRPTVQLGRIPGVRDKRVFVIQDQPAAIELIRAPLNCLMDLYLDKFEYTKSLSDLVVEAQEKTGGSPKIFHRPYADACLPSFIEAACFYALGLEVGIQFALPGKEKIQGDYRATNIQAIPPVDPSLLNVAFQLGQRSLDALR